MGINDFKARLAAAKVGAGGEFVKADFHVHMPASSDYEYKHTDSYDKMASALTSSKTAIAVVLKHQEFPSPSEIEKLQQLCASTSLLPVRRIEYLRRCDVQKGCEGSLFSCNCCR